MGDDWIINTWLLILARAVSLWEKVLRRYPDYGCADTAEVHSGWLVLTGGRIPALEMIG